MKPQRESLHIKIERLRRDFLAELPNRLVKITEDFQHVKQSPDDVALQQALHRSLHNIKGAAASFGLQELRALAIQAETILKEKYDAHSMLDAAAIKQVESILQQLSMQVVPEKKRLDWVQTFPAFELSNEQAQVSQLSDYQPLIYICDDDALLVESLHIQLACFMYKTEKFTSPDALLKAVIQRRPDVVIMDIVFPDEQQGGIDCVQQLQAMLKQPIPVIFISGRDDFDARLYAVRVGGCAYFIKPFNVMDLVDVLDGLLLPKEPKPYRILVIDDDLKVAEYHQLILQEVGMLVKIMPIAEQVLATIVEFKPDLVLVDMYLPTCTGYELAQMIRQIPAYLSLPILYLSSETDAKKQFSALRVGADGFLTKPIEPNRLISEVLLRTERMSAICSLMVRDSLTGLLNHIAILEALKNTLASKQRRQGKMCFAMLDVDNFKRVNDVHGHTVGDQVLLALSRILKQRLRSTDFIGRYGGEEFALVLPGLDLDTAERIVNTLREAFQRVVFNSEQGDFFCSFSAGVSFFPSIDTVHELVNQADRALYKAKHKGRNCVVCADQ